VLTFCQRLRGQIKFPSEAALVEQIAKDIENVRQICR
jgi:FAD synthase